MSAPALEPIWQPPTDVGKTRRGPCDRHGTLEQALASSWDQLDPGPQQCLAQLAVFESRFTAADALLVVDVPSMFVPDGLEALRAAVLLRLEPGSVWLPETVRRFARSKLAPEHPAWGRHAAWATGGPVDLEGLSGMERDALFVRARGRALDLHAVLRRRPDRAARASLWLWRCTDGSATVSARRALLDLGLATSCEPGTAEAHAQLWLLHARGCLALGTGHADAGERDLEVARATAAAARQWSVWALVTHELALLALNRREVARAQELLDETAAEVRDRDMVGSWAMVERSMALVAERRGEREDARRHLALALRLFQEVGDVANEALTLVQRGRLFGAAEGARATRLALQMLSAHRARGGEDSPGVALWRLAGELLTGTPSGAGDALLALEGELAPADAGAFPVLRGLVDLGRGHRAAAEARLRAPSSGAGAALAVQVLRSALDGSAASAVIVVRRDGSGALAPDGVEVDLRRYPLLGRILLMLAEHRERAPGVPATREAVLEAGWPGERMVPTSCTNRLYVSISRLRRAGLGAVLQTRDGGYLLDPAIALVWERAAARGSGWSPSRHAPCSGPMTWRSDVVDDDPGRRGCRRTV